MTGDGACKTIPDPKFNFILDGGFATFRGEALFGMVASSTKSSGAGHDCSRSV